MADRFDEKAATLLDQLTVATMNENYQDRDEDRRTLAEALRQAERDGALRAIETALRIAQQATDPRDMAEALKTLHDRITRGEFP